jgi:hypothetical protein
MTGAEIEAALARAEGASDLKGTGFWRAVDAMRRDRVLAERYADRAAKIDRRAFERGVKVRVPAGIGVLGLLVASVVGVALVAIGVQRQNAIVFILATGALIVGTHSLTHHIVGRVLGIRFTHVFLGGPPPPRPGLKTDYGTYLRSTPKRRAAMHASGAVVTKIVPFALTPFGARISTWLAWLLIGIGVVQILTDVFLSTKVSDWKKVRREFA